MSIFTGDPPKHPLARLYMCEVQQSLRALESHLTRHPHGAITANVTKVLSEDSRELRDVPPLTYWPKGWPIDTPTWIRILAEETGHKSNEGIKYQIRVLPPTGNLEQAYLLTNYGLRFLSMSEPWISTVANGFGFEPGQQINYQITVFPPKRDTS